VTARGERLPVVLVGAGAVGAALGRAAVSAGWPLAAVVCRQAARARDRRALVGAGTPLSLTELLGSTPLPPEEARLLLLCVPDREIAPLAVRLAGRTWPPGSVALHVSGSVPVSALEPLAAAGLATGGLHPLHSFVDPERDAESLAGSVAALEGEAAALAVAREFAAVLRLQAFVLAPGTRALWHAAAAHACNHLVALVAQSLELLARAGLPEPQARAALLPLLRGTLENLAAHPPAAALTGPIARGDDAVVAGHLAALATAEPDISAAYRALAQRAFRLAVERGLADDRRLALAALLLPARPEARP